MRPSEGGGVCVEDLGMRALSRLAAPGRESTPGGERDDGGWHDRPMSSRTPPPPRPVPAGSADEPAAGSVAAALGEDVARAGYYPELVAGCLEVTLEGKKPVAHLVQTETSFADAVHRHLIVLALTPKIFFVAKIKELKYSILLTALFLVISAEIGRASCRKECRSRWSPYH